MSGPEVPTVATVVAAFQRALDAPGEAPAGLLGALVGLHATNLAQWKLEDAARDPTATDAVVASAKHAIDGLNLARHDLIEEVDRAIDERIAQAAAAPPATESPGMAFDRLSVLVIRLHHMVLASGSAAPGAALHAARLPALRDQLASLEAALERLLGDLRSGERSFLPYRQLKLHLPPVEPTTPSSSSRR